MILNNLNYMENFKHFETNLEKENEYPKLVRDNIPEIVEERTGVKVKTKILENDKEYLNFLLKKIEEEANELSNAKDKKHIAEEIADIAELLDAIAEFNGLGMEEIKKIQQEKATKRGGFKKKNPDA